MIGKGVLAAVVALALPAPAGAAQAAFKNNVCKLVSSKVITALAGMSSACTEEAPLPAPGAKQYVGNWKGLASTESLGITILSYSDAGLHALAIHNLKQGGLSTSPTKVSGIGDSAYESRGAAGVEIRIATGEYIAIVVLTNVKKPPASPSEIEPLAKAVVAAL
jgi:hypothetical protein